MDHLCGTRIETFLRTGERKCALEMSKNAMTISSSCAFFFFSPVMALERRKRNPSTSGVAANVMDVSVRSIFVVLFVPCATSLAQMKKDVPCHPGS